MRLQPVCRTWLVTGYVRLPSTHRTPDTYYELGQRLIQIGLPTVAYYQPLEECWLARHHMARGVDVLPNHAPHHGKDTLAYHCVQHEKSAWLARSARHRQPGTLIWIDYGILHVPGVTPELIQKFYERIDKMAPSQITMPGIWPITTPVVDDQVSWIVAGGVVVMPTWAAEWFHRECVAAVDEPTWEVNTWARVCQRWPEHIRRYPADHNELLFTGLWA